MNLDKHNRTVTLLCPICGTTQFSHPDEHSQEPQLLTCASCGRQFTKDELIQANRTNIESELEKMKGAVVQDVRRELQKTLSKAFAGNRHIKFKV